MFGTTASQSKSVAAPDDGFEGFAVIVRDFLAGEAGVLRGDLRGEGPQRDAVRSAVAHGRDVAAQALGVEFLRRRYQRSGKWTSHFSVEAIIASQVTVRCS